MIAHIHYVLVAGSLFAIFAGYYYWAPKWTGHMYNETRGKIHFWALMITLNITFFSRCTSLAWRGCLGATSIILYSLRTST